MTKWLDENTIDGEMTEENFINAVNKHMTERIAEEIKEGKPGNYGNDGLLNVYQEEMEHAGIKFWLRVVRYFAVTRHPNGTFEIGEHKMNRIGKHVTVESDVKIPYDLSDFLNTCEFLYHDTLHSGQESWTLKQQWEHAYELAVEDCQVVPELAKRFDEKVANLQAELVNWLKTLK